MRSMLTPIFERQLSLEQFPILRAHVLEHHAVVPMALQVEWLAHAALHGHPELMFHGFNQLRIFKGIVITPEEPPLVRVFAGPGSHRDGLTFVPVELRGSDSQGRDLLHTRAEVVLTSPLPTA